MSAKPLYLESIKSMAQKMAFVSYDTLQVEGMELKSLWYQYKDLDFYYFEAQGQRIVKIHFSAYGEVVEWNPYDGIRTGMIVQKEQAQGVFEVMHFDARPSERSIEQIKSVLEDATCFDDPLRTRLREILASPVASTEPRSLGRYLWQLIRQIFIFSK